MSVSALRVYIRPVGTILAPQRADGRALRAGGGLAWACPCELIVRDGDAIVARRLIDTGNAAEAIATLDAALRADAEQQWSNLSRIHQPLTLGARTIRLDQPQVMAILNCTPDSLSHDPRFADDPEAAAAAGMQMLEAGAALIDIGGESTRPGATPVWEGDEIKRIVPVIERLARAGAAISVDTRKASVMEAALAAGAHMVNDVSALLHDPRSLDVVRAADCPVVLMHAAGQGPDPHAGSGYAHVLFDVFDWLKARIEAVIAAGVARERILIDPGIGFGKSLADNLALINGIALFHALGQPVLLGASRKRMIGALSNAAPVEQRLAGSLALSLSGVERGVQMLRVHDVAETVQALHVWRGLRDAALTDFSAVLD